MLKNYFKLNKLLIIVLMLASVPGFSQITVTGKVVTFQEDEALPGVNVVVKGTSEGTVTDLNGNYTIQAPSSSSTLVFSYVGYVTEEVQVGNRTVINVQLMPDVEQLSEIVVVGYGTQERGVVTGAVSSVNMDDLESIPIVNAEQALQGRIAGVSVTQTGGGTPGGATQVNIRGVGTINGETPLYIIDGIPVQQGQQNADGYSFLNSLNPNDIESIDILKDASAAAIYGSRASGGVVLISTKRGKAGPVRVNFDAYYGSQTQGQFYDVLNSDQYVNYLGQLHSQPDGDIPPAFAGGQRPSNVSTDWQDELFSAAPIQKYNVGISGGQENALFSLGLEYFDQQGTMRGTGFDRYSLRANSDFKIGDKIKIGETLLLSRTTKDVYTGSGGREPQEHAIKQAPTVPVYDPSFLGGFGFPDSDEGQDAQNPIAIADLNDNVQTRYRVWASLFAEYKIIPNLTYKLQLGLDFNYQDNFNYTPRYEQVRRNINASNLNVSRSQNFNPLLEQFLTYSAGFGKHDLTAMAGFSAQSFEFTNRGVSGGQLPDGVINVEAANANITPSYSKVETSLRSLFGRLTYSYDDKYLLTANLRYDESSKLFRANEPSGIFPSVSAGWRISEEPFMQNVPFISDLKLRAGYGELGNQTPLSAYPIDVLLRTDFFYVLGDNIVQGITQNDLANPNITWETTKQIDIGMDVGLFANKLTLNLDYYQRNTVDLLWRQEVPQSVGLNAPFVNAGEVQNNGIEAALTYKKSEGDFQFDISGNITTINNEVVSLVNEDLIIRRGGVTDDIGNVSWTQVGEPIGSFYGFVTDGLFRSWDEVYDHAYQNQKLSPSAGGTTPADYYTENRADTTATTNTAPGDIRFVDVNGDGVVDNEDRTNLGSPIPDFTYGLTFNGRFKGFDFQVFLQGAHGHQIYNAAKRWLVDFRQNFNNGIEATNSAPYSPNYTAPEARLVRADPNQNVLRSSDRYVFDGSYMRIKNLTVGYSLPQNLLDNIGATRTRVYGTVQNLATFTDYFGLEPDVGSLSEGNALDAGIDRLIYPQPTTFIVGIQVGF